jgi:hypothetical protein
MIYPGYAMRRSLMFQLVLACLVLFWDLTDGRWVEACPPQSEICFTHSKSDVVPYSLRYRQQNLEQVVNSPANCPSLEAVVVTPSGAVSPWREDGTHMAVMTGWERLYLLMSLQR